MKQVCNGEKFCVSVKDIILFDSSFENLLSAKLEESSKKSIRILKEFGRRKRAYILSSKSQPVDLSGGIDVGFDNIHYQIGLTKFATYKENSQYDEDFVNYDRSIEWITYLLKKYRGEYLKYAKLAFRKLERDMHSAYNQEFGSYNQNHKDAYHTASNYNKYLSKNYQIMLLKSIIKDVENEEQAE